MNEEQNKKKTVVFPNPQAGPVHKVTVPIPAGAHLEILRFEYYVVVHNVTLMVFSWHNRFYIINVADIADQTAENTARPVEELCDNSEMVVPREQHFNLPIDPADSDIDDSFDLTESHW